MTDKKTHEGLNVFKEKSMTLDQSASSGSGRVCGVVVGHITNTAKYAACMVRVYDEYALVTHPYYDILVRAMSVDAKEEMKNVEVGDYLEAEGSLGYATYEAEWKGAPRTFGTLAIKAFTQFRILNKRPTASQPPVNDQDTLPGIPVEEDAQGKSDQGARKGSPE